MPLIIAPIGKEMVVVNCRLEQSLKRHLENLGVLCGSKITVIKESNGDVIVQVKDARVALNKDLASKIVVH